MKRFLFPLTIAIAALITACSVKRHYTLGCSYYDATEYSRAITHFEKYNAKKFRTDAIVKTADSYRHLNDYSTAESYYKQVADTAILEPVVHFDYARVLMSLGKYDQAKTEFKAYLNKVPGDVVARMLLASCNSVNTMLKDSGQYSVSEVEMPEISTAFAQTPFQKGIIFTADKNVMRNSQKYQWTGRSYLDLYYSRKDDKGRWMSPMVLKGSLSGPYHEGPACFAKDGNLVYFTRSNMNGKRIKKNKNNENTLKICTARFDGDKWTDMKELPFDSDDYSCAHPSLSADEKTLYFTSDMPGGFGGTDIYMSTYDGTTWSKPINLGAVINTSGNEMFPYMHHDGTFYFSSDAHNNFGGLDVFMTSFQGDRWLQVENLNYPVNTPADDFAFVVNEDDNSGYVSSNRSSSDKIYEVTKINAVFSVSGRVLERSSNHPLDSVQVDVYNTTTHEHQFVMTDPKGQYVAELKAEMVYRITAARSMYFMTSKVASVSTMGLKKSATFSNDIYMAHVVPEKPVVLENIYYDFDKWAIRPDAARELDRLVTFLNSNPTVRIEMGSHTDSRAGDQYNLVLSDKRARAAVEYLKSKGISEKRLTWKGYGESMLVNHCSNDVWCSEKDHQMNRRTTFKVIRK